MLAVPEFDHVCQGPGENVIVDLVRNPDSFPRLLQGVGAKSMAEWPTIDRTLWPKPASRKLRRICRRNPSCWRLRRAFLA